MKKIWKLSLLILSLEMKNFVDAQNLPSFCNNIVNNVEFENNNSINIYPNHSSQMITIDISDISQFFQQNVRNSFGVCLFNKKIKYSERQTIIDIKSFPNGIYLPELANKKNFHVKIFC